MELGMEACFRERRSAMPPGIGRLLPERWRSGPRGSRRLGGLGVAHGPPAVAREKDHRPLCQGGDGQERMDPERTGEHGAIAHIEAFVNRPGSGSWPPIEYLPLV